MSNAERIAKLIAEGRIEGALEQADIGGVNLLLKTGISFCQKGQYYIAEKIFDRVTQLDPKNGMAWYHKGNAFYGLKNYKCTIKCFDKSLEINPNVANAWYIKGLVHGRLRRTKRRRHEEAIECFDKALKINPKYANAWYNKGIALYHLKRHIEAIECYNKAFELNQEHAEAWYNKGAALDHLERHEEAIECFDKALEINSKDANAWYNKGIALDHVKRHEEAIECFDKALEINPKDANVWYNKGVTLENLEKYEEAIKCFSAALEIKPNINNKALQNLLSLLDKKLGTYEKLEEGYEITKALDPKILRLLLKKRFSALENTPLEKIQEIARKSPRNIIFRKNLITKLSLLGKHNEAVDSARKLVSEFPKSKFSHLQLGVSYIQNRRILNPCKRYSLIKKAEKEYNDAIEIDPNFALAHLDLALLYSYTGHEGKAKKEFEKAFNLEPQYIQACRNFLDESDEKYEGKYDHKDIISKIFHVIKTTGKIAFIGAVGTGIALGGVVSGTTDKMTPLGDDLTSIQASSAYILDQETLPFGLLDHSLNEGDMIKESNIKTPFTPPPKNSNGVYLPVRNESILKAVEQSILDKKQKETFMIYGDTLENGNNKVFSYQIKNQGTREREDNGLKDAFDGLDSAAIAAIISYLFYRKNKKDQQKRDDEMYRKIEELITDEKNDISSMIISDTIKVPPKLGEELVRFLDKIQEEPSARSYLEVKYESDTIKVPPKLGEELVRFLDKIQEEPSARSYLEVKYELAKVYETLARIHQRLGNNRAAMGNIDHATTLYLEIGNMDLGLKYRTPEPNKDFAKEVLQEKRIE